MAKFELQSLQTSVTDTDVSGSLEKQCQLMDQVVADARSLTFELSNPVLYQVGVEAAVESYLTEQIQGQFGIKCKFKSEGPHSSLEEDIRVVLFQAVRELLANIVKHAMQARSKYVFRKPKTGCGLLSKTMVLDLIHLKSASIWWGGADSDFSILERDWSILAETSKSNQDQKMGLALL